MNSFKARNIVVEYFLKYPAVGITVIYIFLSFLGIYYNWIFFKEFNLNIFDFITVDDFLIGAIKDINVFFDTAFIGFLFLLLLYTIIWRPLRLYEKIEIKHGLDSKHYRLFRATTATTLVVFILGTSTWGYKVAAMRSARIIDVAKEGKFSIKLRPDSGTNNSEILSNKVMLLGSTGRCYVFLEPSNRKILIIPNSNIYSISYQLDKPKSDRNWVGY